MQTYSDLNHSFSWIASVKNRHFRPYKVALLVAVLSCLTFGAKGASAMKSFTCTPSTMSGPGSVTCTVVLIYPTPAGGSLVTLSSNSSNIVVPASLRIPAGGNNVTFTAPVSSFSSPSTVTLTATSGGAGMSFAVQLNPSAGSLLSGLSCSSATMTGAGSFTCTATLSGPAPSGGTVVNLSTISSGHKLTVPASVTIPASAAKASFVATVASFQTAQPATITATAGGVSYSYTLQLSPATANLSINATNVSFGDVAVGSQATQTVTLTSSGQAAVTVSSASVTGTGFSLSGASFPVTLNPGQTLALDVQFAPTATGAASGQLAIKSSSSSNPTASVALSGTGGTHQVDLTWNSPGSSPAPVTGYNIYRAPTGTGSYQRINTSVDPGTAYSDTSVKSGAYDYVIKSVSSSGIESAPSTVGTATIP